MTQQLPVQTLQPMIRVLSDEQVRVIHNATLEILGQTGVEMQDPQGRELLLEAGAWESDGPSTGSGESRIKIPENLVTEAIASAPVCIPLHDRLGNLTMPLELGRVFFGSGSDTTFTLTPAASRWAVTCLMKTSPSKMLVSKDKKVPRLLQCFPWRMQYLITIVLYL